MAASATVIEYCNFRDNTDLHSLSNCPNELTFANIWADDIALIILIVSLYPDSAVVLVENPTCST